MNAGFTAGSMLPDEERPVPRLLPSNLGAGLMLLTAAHAAAAQPVGRVGVQPTVDAEKWVAQRPSSRACIDASQIAGAAVVDHRTVDVILRGGDRWRLMLGQQCAQLGFYGGFYYHSAQAERFCAGQGQLIGRAGGACRVARMARLTRVSR